MSQKKIIEDHLVSYLPQIRKVVCKIVKNEDVIDDISQECCVRIIEKEHIWDGNVLKLDQWMNMISRNLAIRSLQKKIVKSINLSQSQDIALKKNEPPFSEEQIKWVMNQFSKLSTKHQKILKLKYYHGLKTMEIAKALNMPHQNVSRDIALALKKIKRQTTFQAFTAPLLPWNWDMKFLVKVFLMKIKIAAVVLFIIILTTMIYLGTKDTKTPEINSISVVSNNLSNDKNTTSEEPTDISPEDTSTINVAENKPVNNELEDTLKWLRKIFPHSYNDITAEDLKNITTISFSRTRGVTVEDLNKHLRNLPALTYIDLHFTKFGNGALKALSNLTSLKKLNLEGAGTTREGLKYLTSLTTLEEIRFTAVNIKDEDLQQLTTLQSLKSLDLGMTKITDKGIDILTSFPLLSELILYDTKITDKSLKSLAAMNSLEKLNLLRTAITNEGLKELSSSPSLTELSLSRPYGPRGKIYEGEIVNDNGLNYLNSLTTLKTLTINNLQFTAVGLRNIGQHNSLTSLRINRARLNDKAMRSLSVNNSLTSLDLSNNKLTGENLGDLAQITSLEHLNLKNNNLTDECLDGLAQITSLKNLSLNNNKLSKEGLKKLKKALPDCRIDSSY